MFNLEITVVQQTLGKYRAFSRWMATDEHKREWVADEDKMCFKIRSPVCRCHRNTVPAEREFPTYRSFRHFMCLTWIMNFLIYINSMSDGSFLVRKRIFQLSILHRLEEWNGNVIIDITYDSSNGFWRLNRVFWCRLPTREPSMQWSRGLDWWRNSLKRELDCN